MIRRKNPSGSFNGVILFSIIILFLISLSNPTVKAQNRTRTVSVNVGLVFDDLELSEGKAISSAINMSLSDFYATHADYKTRLVINLRDSKNEVVNAASAALDLIENVRVQAILGPRTSLQADFVINLGEKAQVPIITFTASSPFLTSFRSPFFFMVSQNDSTQVKAMSAVVQAFGWREAVIIYIDNDYGRGILPYLIDGLGEVNAQVPYRSSIPPNAADDIILAELYKLKTMQTRVFIVHMPHTLGSKLFIKAEEADMVGEGYVWIMTDGMTNFLSKFNTTVLNSMEGVLGVRPHIPITEQLQDFKSRWSVKFQRDNPSIVGADLDIFGLWGCDATTALAMAIEQAGSGNLFSDQKADGSSKYSSPTDLDSLGVSLNGQNLIQALSNVSFSGLTGNFHFVDGQLPASVYQIVNVHADGARRIGFWTPEKGLVKNLNTPTSYMSSHSTLSSSLAPIIWPGGSTSVPKGWDIPTTGKKLRIGVPVKKGFLEFVNVSRDPNTNKTTVTGYSIDVFKAVVEVLPYSLPYEFIPFEKPNGEPAGTYDDLVDQVYLGNYDAVVGDVAIRSNRSTRVDFTLPYREAGVRMVVPVKDAKNKNAWAFLKPLTWQLWLTCFCFFIWIGFVIWLLEHRINTEFSGSPLQQVGTGFWFSFSTMIFAQKERVVSNLTRMVVVIWCFVVLILSQSYTASLASLLTVQQFQPRVSEIHELIESGEKVGYEQGSYEKGILQGLGFNESNLVMFKSTEELDRLFQLGSGQGGISAAFDDAQFMKLFLEQYCNKYTIVKLTFQTDGFGFVFPKGSPLVSDVSQAILELKEGDKMKRIEEEWLGNQKDCMDSSTSVTSTTLDLDSFWGLFLIAGLASFLALAISINLFLRKNKEDPSEFETSTWRRLCKFLSIYNEKDWKSSAFKNAEQIDITTIDCPGTAFKNAEQIDITTIDCPGTGAPSPSTLFVNSYFLEREVARPSMEVANPNSDSPDIVVVSDKTN